MTGTDNFSKRMRKAIFQTLGHISVNKTSIQ